MQLNLQILQADLAPVAFEACCANKPHELTCTYPLLFVRGMDLRPRHVYVARAEDLPCAFVAYEPFDLICVDRPSDAYLTGPCNVLWTAEDLDPVELFARVADVFDRYEGWCSKMEAVLQEGRPIHELGTVSLPYIGNPFYLQGRGFKNIFYAVGHLDEATCVVPDLDAYRASLAQFKVDAYMPLEGAAPFATDRDFADAYRRNEPTLLCGSENLYPCKCLFRNIGAASHPLGRLFIDEVGHIIGPKDYALSTILERYLRRALSERPVLGFDRSSQLSEAIEAVLAGKLADPQAISAAFARVGWAKDDRFTCLVAESSTRLDEDCATVGRHLAEMYPNIAQIVYDGRLVVLVNLTHVPSRILPSALEDAVALALGAVGVSEEYEGFSLTRSFYTQALAALQLGCLEAGDGVHHYADLRLDDFLRRCSEGFSPMAVCPQGLRALMAYDHEHGTSLVELLRLYLDCNMNASRTAAESFLHRNTCMNQIARAVQIGDLHLDDPKENLVLRIALHVLEGRARRAGKSSQ